MTDPATSIEPLDPVQTGAGGGRGPLRRLPLLAGTIGVGFALACQCGKPCVSVSDAIGDDTGCPVTKSCDYDDWGGLRGPEYVFVDADSIFPPEGTASDPDTSIQRALNRAADTGATTVLVVADWMYLESLELGPEHDGLTLVAPCGQFQLVADDQGDAIVLDGAADTVVAISGARVSSASGSGIVTRGGRLVLADVDVEGSVGSGLSASGRTARIDVSDGSVANTLVGGGGIGDGVGVAVTGGALLVAEGLAVSGSAVGGALIDGVGTRAELTDATFDVPLDTTGSTDSWPFGIRVVGAELTLNGGGVSGAGSVGIELSGGSAVLDAVTVSGTRMSAAGGDGTGVQVSGGGTLTATGLVVTDSELYGVAASGAGTTVDWVGGAARETADSPLEPSAGIGLLVYEGAAATVSRVEVTESHVFGLVASGPGSTLDLAEVEVRDTAPGGALGLGGGVLVEEGATLSAEALTVSGSGSVGIVFERASGVLTGVAVEATERGTDASAGVGVLLQLGSTVEADGLDVRSTQGPGVLVSASDLVCTTCTLVDNAFAGVVAADGADLELRDVVVTGTTDDLNEGGGVGLYADSSAAPVTVTVTGATVRDNLHAGVYVLGDGDVRLEASTLEGGPAERTLWPRGTAVYASGTTSAGLRLAGNTVAESDGAGLFLDHASATLAGNTWSANAVDVVQQVCDGTDAPVGLDAEPVQRTELCPPYDYPVGPFTFSLEHQTIEL